MALSVDECDRDQLNKIIDLAILEDLGHGDVTTDSLIPPNLQGEAYIEVKADGVLAGNEVAKEVFAHIDPSLKFKTLIKDGSKVKRGDKVATISGSASSILKAERVAVNFLQKLSGVATVTAQYVAQTKGFSGKLTDTRKTTPGLRVLEKYAVRMGGGKNHRLHLGDGILIKDNHLVAMRSQGLSLKEIIAKARKNSPKGTVLEVEVTTAAEAREAADSEADIILLDNMSPAEMRRVVSLIRKKNPTIKFEASGGITLETLPEVITTGVDIISVGALTHSSKALNISLELEPKSLKLG